MEWMRNQLWEIEKSASLRIFGGLLALTHALTFLYWQLQGHLPLAYYTSTPMCWTLFENCLAMRIVPLSVFTALYYFYFVLSLLTACVFFFTRATLLNWGLLFSLFLLKAFFYIQDYRLSSNIHYFLFCLQLIYLFVPSKQNVLKGFIVSYYLATGMLKLSPEWLTGQWFMSHKITRPKFAEWCAAISVLVEMIGGAALLFKKGKYFVIGFLVLVLYQAVLWWFDGFFPALVQIMALSLFWLAGWEERKFESELLYQSYLRPEPSNLWAGLTLIVFWAIQLIPFLALEQTHPVVETLALDRLASNLECRLTTFAHFNSRIEQISVDAPSGRPIQTQCSPYLKFLDAKQACDQFAGTQGFQTVSAYFDLRTLKDPEYKRIFEVEDICKPEVKFRGNVSWNTTPTAE